MVVDDLVIGSGLAGLGAVLGLLDAPDRRTAVLCGPGENRFLYYDGRRTVPCAYLGRGGLGSHWHGVVPMGWRHRFGAGDDAAFAGLFQRFYRRTSLQGRLGTAALFVPWRPVRPARELVALAARLPGSRLTLVDEAALDLRFDERGVSVTTPAGIHRARRAWVAAGALHTPALLGRSVAPRACRDVVSDHAFCYVGQVEGQPAPAVTRGADGAFFPARYDAAHRALYTLRPAVFDFRSLDAGIEQRALFGLPTGSALVKLARRLSAGVLVEALYNRFGVLGAAQTHSVYAQTVARDAYALRQAGDGPRLEPAAGCIRAATDAARAAQPFDGLRHSLRPELHIPGIHLHHSLDEAELRRAGVNQGDSPVQVVDASVLDDIGPDHHAFKMMLSAQQRARLSGRACVALPSVPEKRT